VRTRILAAAVTLLACGAGWKPAEPELGESGQVLRAERPVPGQYVVVFKDVLVRGDDVAAESDALSRGHGGQLLRTWRAAIRGFAVRMTEAQAQALAADPRVAFVEEDAEVHLDATQAGATWGLDRIDQLNRPLDGSYTSNVDGSGVSAYIIDTGLRTTHAQFGGRASGSFSAITDGNGTNDCNGHGTHVTGTVGGSTYGVAKNVRLFAVRVLDCQGSGSISGVISGIDWVTSNHLSPAVANMSLGGAASTALDQAVRNSIASGVTYAIAAGNSAADACGASPARVATAITVGASDINDLKASFSNFGTCVDLFAPGVSITSSWATGDTATNTISGTSMATPHVTGAAALYLSANPAATPAQVASALVANASAGVLTSVGTGSPNKLLYEKFIGAVAGPPDTTPPTATLSTPAAGTVSGTVTLTATASDDVGVARLEFLVDGVVVATDTATPFSFAWNSGSVANGSHALGARATDTSGNASAISSVAVTVSNTTPPPPPPPPIGCTTTTELLGNPGFETGTAAPWVATAGVVDSLASPPPHSGTSKAQLAGTGTTHTDTLAQAVTLPAGACSATLSFWLWITTAEPSTLTRFDNLTVTVRDAAGAVTTLATYSNLDHSAGYVQRSFDLSTFEGQAITVQFQGSEDVIRQTSFIIDDASVTVTE
jgi:subtilisin family serine protease